MTEPWRDPRLTLIREPTPDDERAVTALRLSDGSVHVEVWWSDGSSRSLSLETSQIERLRELACAETDATVALTRCGVCGERFRVSSPRRVVEYLERRGWTRERLVGPPHGVDRVRYSDARFNLLEVFDPDSPQPADYPRVFRELLERLRDLEGRPISAIAREIAG